MSSDVGAYLLAATGLLDGLRATTHWRYAEDFAARFPSVTVLPDALYVDEGRLITGAGGVATLDMYLHLIRREYGLAVAKTFGREVVMASHRDGSQAQYLTTPLPMSKDDERLTALLAWVQDNLHEPVSVEQLAARVMMSTRTFTRRFKAMTGATPHAWLLNHRLARAEELLETTGLPMNEVAQRVGYANPAVLREQFVKRRGIPPRQYRQTFGTRTASQV